MANWGSGRVHVSGKCSKYHCRHWLRLGKARLAFRAMDKLDFPNIWKSNKSEDIQLQCAKSVLLYSRTVTQRDSRLFINNCLRSILNIHWPERIINKELWKKGVQLRSRKWKWICHTVRQSDDSIAKQVLQWMSQGHRGRVWPRIT